MSDKNLNIWDTRFMRRLNSLILTDRWGPVTWVKVGSVSENNSCRDMHKIVIRSDDCSVSKIRISFFQNLLSKLVHPWWNGSQVASQIQRSEKFSGNCLTYFMHASPLIRHSTGILLTIPGKWCPASTAYSWADAGISPPPNPPGSTSGVGWSRPAA